MAAALGLRAAERGQRALIIETANDGSLAQLFGHRKLGAARSACSPASTPCASTRAQLVEEYFSRLLRFQWLSDRLLSSNTFNALTAAAPGITEFLLLEKILGWVEPGFGARRRGYDVVIVDGPATGHALKLLRTPRRIATMVPGGPLGKTARRLLALLADHQRTQVLLVSLPEEMAVRETIETQHALATDLARARGAAGDQPRLSAALHRRRGRADRRRRRRRAGRAHPRGGALRDRRPPRGRAPRRAACAARSASARCCCASCSP